MIDLNKLIELAEKATHCSVCNSPVIHHKSDEGTQYYEPIVSSQTIKKLCEVIRVYEEALVNIKASADLGENTKDYFYNCTTINALAKGKSILDGE